MCSSSRLGPGHSARGAVLTLVKEIDSFLKFNRLVSVCKNNTRQKVGKKVAQVILYKIGPLPLSCTCAGMNTRGYALQTAPEAYPNMQG